MIIKKENEFALGCAILSEIANWYITNAKFMKANNRKVAENEDSLYIIYATSLWNISNNNFKALAIADDCGIDIVDIPKLKELKEYKENNFIINVGSILTEQNGVDSVFSNPNKYLSIINGFNNLFKTEGKHWVLEEDSEETLSDIATDSLAD